MRVPLANFESRQLQKSQLEDQATAILKSMIESGALTDEVKSIEDIPEEKK
jgi:hypothetical protein